MEYLSSDKVGIIDLASGDVSEDELSEDLVSQKIGGAAITAHLYQEHADGDPIVLGAGLLTGTMVPASSLGIMTAKSPVTGSVVHAPITQYAGMEIKYSGFDYLVIKGKAAEPSLLWLHDGIADLEPAGNLMGLNVWEAVAAIRQDKGDEMIQVLGAGPAAEKGSDLAQVMINFWASGDRFGLGKAMMAKNIKAIAIRGMGLLEVAEDEEFVNQCVELVGEVKAGATAGKKGLGDLGAALGYADFGDWLAPLVHRHRASFNTPFAYNTFLMLEGDPAQLTEPSAEAPGVLITDPEAAGMLKKLGLSLADAGQVLRQAAKLGIDAAGAAKVCEAGGQDIKTALDGLTGAAPDLAGPFSPWAPKELAGDEAAWLRRQAVAYIFGLDPIFALMCPELSEDKLVALAALGTELEIDAEALNSAIGSITG